MITQSQWLKHGDVLKDGAVVSSSEPVDHDTYVSVIVRYANGTIRIRDFDKGLSLDVGRPRANPFIPQPISPLEEDHARRASDDYERSLGL